MQTVCSTEYNKKKKVSKANKCKFQSYQHISDGNMYSHLPLHTK